MNRRIQAARLLCIMLAIILAGAALVAHSHECLSVRCVECTVRRAFSCAALVLGGRLMMQLIVLQNWGFSGLRAAETGETLVQMKVKLSN